MRQATLRPFFNGFELGTRFNVVITIQLYLKLNKIAKIYNFFKNTFYKALIATKLAQKMGTLRHYGYDSTKIFLDRWSSSNHVNHVWCECATLLTIIITTNFIL